MSKYKIEIEGSNAGGMRAVNETREAMEKLRGGVGGLSNALSGDLVGGATSALGALRGLWALLLSNPLLAVAAGLGLIVTKLLAAKAASAEMAAQVAADIRKLTNPELGMSPDARAGYFEKQGGRALLANKLNEAEADAFSKQGSYEAELQLSGKGGDPARLQAALKAKLEADNEVAALRDRLSDMDRRASDRTGAAQAETAAGQKAYDEQRAAARQETAEKQRSLTLARLPDVMKPLFIASEIEELEAKLKDAVADSLDNAKARNTLLDRRLELLQIETQLAEASQREDERAAAAAKKAADDKAEAAAAAKKKKAEDQQRADEKKVKDAEKLAEDERAKELRQNRRGSADYLQDLRDSVGARGSRALAGTHTAVTKDQQQRTEMIALLREIRDRSGLAF